MSCVLSRAFSLLELMLVLVLMGVALVFAVAGFHAFSKQSTASAAIQRLYADIRLTQSTAIRRGHTVVLCGSQDGLVCDGDWAAGRLIEDLQMGQRLRYDRLGAFGGKWVWRSSFGRNDYLKFAPTGFTLGQQGRFYYCPKSESIAERAVVVAQSGRLRVEQREHQACASFY
jgi:type IV fimbrial biogenesis protein FimT